MSVGEGDRPAPRSFRVDGLDEDFLVYEGTLLMTVPVLFTSNVGPTTLALEVAYQACTDTTCFPPTSIRVELPLTGLDLIRD
jgi:DsbC/DsbD-like thiol-disulfide interchange protein